MIDKKPNGYQISCDACSNQIYIPKAIGFKHAVDEAKTSGWINRQISGEWMNFCCSECYEERKNV